MPWRAPTDSQLCHSRRQTDARYNAERASKRGPDPRSTARWRKLRALKLAQHSALARRDRETFGSESGLVKVNTTALYTILRKLKAWREHSDEHVWYSTSLNEAESEQAERLACGEEG